MTTARLSLPPHRQIQFSYQPLELGSLDLLGQGSLSFFNVLMTVFLLILSTRAVSRIPLELIAISTIFSVIPSSHAL